MKKYILIIILIISCLILSGCGKTIKESYYNYEQEHQVLYDHYAIVKEYDAGFDGKTSLVYDLDTRVMYQLVWDGHRCGMSEYYIVKNNKPEIGIYGYNYKGE